MFLVSPEATNQRLNVWGFVFGLEVISTVKSLNIDGIKWPYSRLIAINYEGLGHVSSYWSSIEELFSQNASSAITKMGFKRQWQVSWLCFGEELFIHM